MQQYKFNRAFVLRDIGGIYFAVNVKDKRIYQDKKMYAFNQTGFCLLQLAESLESFNPYVLCVKFITLLSGIINESDVLNDVQEFCTNVFFKGIFDSYEK